MNDNDIATTSGYRRKVGAIKAARTRAANTAAKVAVERARLDRPTLPDHLFTGLCVWSHPSKGARSKFLRVTWDKATSDGDYLDRIERMLHDLADAGDAKWEAAQWEEQVARSAQRTDEDGQTVLAPVDDSTAKRCEVALGVESRAGTSLVDFPALHYVRHASGSLTCGPVRVRR
jgi:hypothetical protein